MRNPKKAHANKDLSWWFAISEGDALQTYLPLGSTWAAKSAAGILQGSTWAALTAAGICQKHNTLFQSVMYIHVVEQAVMYSSQTRRTPYKP